MFMSLNSSPQPEPKHPYPHQSQEHLHWAKLGLVRILTEVNGYEAVKLWWSYVNDNDKDALATLLEYNKEDVINLKTLKEMLL